MTSKDLLELHFQVFEKGSYYCVRLLPAAVEGPWELDQRTATQFQKSLDLINSNACGWDDINDVGRELWTCLRPGAVGDAFDAQYAEQMALWKKRDESSADFLIRLDLPDVLRDLPWESLYQRNISSLGLANRPRFCIVHSPPPEANIPDYKGLDGSSLSMLVIAPEGSQLDVTRELEGIKRVAAARKIRLKVLQQGATLSSVHCELDGARWDIVHYVGHGRVNPDGRIEILLNDEGGGPAFLDGELVCQSFQSADVRLAVFNCCRGAGDSAARPDMLNGLGPMLMRTGVPAVISMRYDIEDHMASVFARTFYEALLQGRKPGRVDIAIAEARGAISRNNLDYKRNVITPILHLAPGYHELFTFAPEVDSTAVRRPAVAEPEIAPAVIETRPRINPQLLDIIKQGRCVPVIGPGILRAGISRADLAPPGPLELVKHLTSPPRQYPRKGDLDFCREDMPSTDWLHTQVLQWVCQNIVHEKPSWADLAGEIRALYDGKFVLPDSLRKLAQLKWPGAFYTWFDGLLHDCVLRGNSTLNQAVTVLSPAGADQSVAMQMDRRPLVLLRGSVNQPKSLVITEDDHEKLATSIARMPPELLEITRKNFPCSVLFIGVSPREPLVHQLCQALLDSNTRGRRMQGPTFFLCSNDEVRDHAYWAQYDTAWIVDDLDPFLADLLRAVQ